MWLRLQVLLPTVTIGHISTNFKYVLHICLRLSCSSAWKWHVPYLNILCTSSHSPALPQSGFLLLNFFQFEHAQDSVPSTFIWKFVIEVCVAFLHLHPLLWLRFCFPLIDDINLTVEFCYFIFCSDNSF